MKDVWHLKRVDWRQQLSDEEAKKLFSTALTREHAAGEMVFTPEPVPHSVYLLDEGLVRVYRLSEEGAETTFGYVSPGEVFGELAGFGDYPRESFAQAVRKSRIWKIPRAAFQQLVSARPDLAIVITRQIGERLKRIESRVENLVFRDVKTRVAHILLELAEDFGRPVGSRLVIDVALTQSELATLVGSTRQTVNASLRELEAEQLLDRSDGRIVLNDPDALRRATGKRPD